MSTAEESLPRASSDHAANPWAQVSSRVKEGRAPVDARAIAPSERTNKPASLNKSTSDKGSKSGSSKSGNSRNSGGGSSASAGKSHHAPRRASTNDSAAAAAAARNATSSNASSAAAATAASSSSAAAASSSSSSSSSSSTTTTGGRSREQRLERHHSQPHSSHAAAHHSQRQAQAAARQSNAQRMAMAAAAGFSVDKFLVDLYKFAENNAPSRHAPLYWYDTSTKMWMPGVGQHSLGVRPFDNIAPVFFGQYPYPVFYPGNKVEFGSLYQRRPNASRNSQRLNKHSIGPSEREQFGLRIKDSKFVVDDARTSLMIRNIPNKYTQAMLLKEIEPYKGQFDLFYLPIDFHNKCNVGYAFINMVDSKFVPAFYEHFHGLRWSQFNSSKVCELTYARIQGQRNMLKHFQNSRVLVEHPIYRPIVFSGSELDNSWPLRVLDDDDDDEDEAENANKNTTDNTNNNNNNSKGSDDKGADNAKDESASAAKPTESAATTGASDDKAGDEAEAAAK